MKRHFYNWVEPVIHGVITVDESDSVRIFCHQTAQKKVHFFALKTLVVRILADLEHLHRRDAAQSGRHSDDRRYVRPEDLCG